VYIPLARRTLQPLTTRQVRVLRNIEGRLAWTIGTISGLKRNICTVQSPDTHGTEFTARLEARFFVRYRLTKKQNVVALEDHESKRSRRLDALWSVEVNPEGADVDTVDDMCVVSAPDRTRLAAAAMPNQSHQAALYEGYSWMGQSEIVEPASQQGGGTRRLPDENPVQIVVKPVQPDGDGETGPTVVKPGETCQTPGETDASPGAYNKILSDTDTIPGATRRKAGETGARPSETTRPARLQTFPTTVAVNAKLIADSIVAYKRDILTEEANLASKQAILFL
jgi:hypothetical protein